MNIPPGLPAAPVASPPAPATRLHRRLAASLLVLAGLAATGPFASPLRAAATFRAGAHAEDVSPTRFPAPVNGGLKARFADDIHDPMHARVLAVSDGRHEIIFCVVDTCLIPRGICEQAKEIASGRTGVPRSQILISATHTHSAAAMTPAFQSDPDPEYVASLPARIAAGLIRAHENMEPAEIGWAFGSDPSQVFNRRWFMKTGKSYENPFGSRGDRARMNPGHQNPDISIPTGPIDPEVAILAVRSAADQRPLGVLANYSLHYVGGHPAVSADYYAAFANDIGRRLGAGDVRYRGKPAFVGIMSNGTSGNINNNDIRRPSTYRLKGPDRIAATARSVADAALEAYATIEWSATAPLDSIEEDLTLGVRKASPSELARAREILATTPKGPDGQWGDRRAVYAREAIKLADYPDTVPAKIQVHRIGALSIAASPCEVFVEIGLELKKTTPFTRHFTIGLANGYNGYLPTPEHHALGGYETWRARSSYLETQASVKITDRLQAMLATLADRAR